MVYYFVDPEVAGDFGDNIVMDTTVHPPQVSKLHYRFQGWLGDSLLESFPCYIVTSDLAKTITERKLTGATFDLVEISKSEIFEELYPGRELPNFRWMKVHGKAGVDDIGVHNLRLVVSHDALTLFKSFGLHNAAVEVYSP